MKACGALLCLLFWVMCEADPEVQLQLNHNDQGTELELTLNNHDHGTADKEHKERLITCGNGENVHRLSCENGVIEVEKALYGRSDRETCSAGRPPAQVANTTCSQEGTLDVLARRCNGKKVCELSVNDFRTSDPCVGTFKYLDSTHTCLPAISLVACEHSLAHLYCEAGQVIAVRGADYGRRDQTTCSYKRPAGQVQKVDCSSPATKVAESCNGKNECTINVSNSEFGDPCVGTFKYMEVAYNCLYPEV